MLISNNHRVLFTVYKLHCKGYLRQASTNLTAKFAVCKSTDDLFTASSAGAFPCNGWQVADMRGRQDEKEMSSFSQKRSPIFSDAEV